MLTLVMGIIRESNINPILTRLNKDSYNIFTDLAAYAFR